MASRPWSDDELALLEAHADLRPNWLLTVAGKIKDRSAKAIKVRMAKLRDEMDMGDGRCVGEEDEAKFITSTAMASQALLAAIQRAGVHP